MMIRSIVWLVAVSVLAISPASALDDVWNRFRGPNGTGISTAKTVPVQWTEKVYNWTIDLPAPGYSSPVIWENRIFVTCGDPTTALRSLLAIDAPTGRTLWKHQEPSKTYEQHRDNGYATATPTVDADGVVITWTTPEAVMLLALDLEGKEVWRRDLGPLVSLQGSGSSPILYQDLVVLVNDQEDMALGPRRNPNGPSPIGRSSVIAVERKTGKTRWQTEIKTSMAGYTTPCIDRPNSGPAQMFFANTAQGILSLDPATGKINWTFGEPFPDRAVVSPVLAPGLVLAGHGAGIRGTRFIAVRPGSAGGPAAPTLAYTLTSSIPMVPTPLVKDGRLYLWGDDGVVSCHRVATGERVWRERINGNFFASPIWVDGRLYNVSKKGEVVVVAAQDKFELLHHLALGEPSYATPAVSGGVMYLRTNSRLYSLGGRR